MQAVINDAIAAGLCGDQGAAHVIASSQSFGGFGNQVSVANVFYYRCINKYVKCLFMNDSTVV